MKIRKILYTGLFLIATVNSFSQVNELEAFRKKLTLFIYYDLGKVDSIPKTALNTVKLKKEAQDAFIRFILNKDSKNLDNLKQQAKSGGGSYWFNQYSYYFNNQRRIPTVKSLDNNVNYNISFYGLYDYQLSNFVSMYMQPYTVDGKEYVVYYYSTNGEGTYYVKDLSSNKIVYKGAALTSNAPIHRLNKIDDKHLLIVEDMGDNGLRAIVLESDIQNWTSVKGFKGNAFTENTKDFSKKVFTDKRAYLRLASNRTIATHYGSRYLNIAFDENSKTISYKQNSATPKSIEATWKNNQFAIDDYYLGEHLSDKPVPMPD